LRRANARVGERASENVGVSEGEILDCLEIMLREGVVRSSESGGPGD